MPDAIKTELITRDFNRMLEELAAIDPRVEFADVTRSEAISVCSGAMGRTRAATVEAINRRQAGKKVVTFGGKVHFLENHWPNDIWSEINRLMKESLQTKLGARGMAKQTWYNAALRLGRAIPAPGYVMAANYKGRQFTENVNTLEAGGGAEFLLTLTNTSPLGKGAGMENAMLNAMGGRAAYFRRNMENRAFRTLAERAAKYPGIFSTPVPAPAD